MSLTVATWNVNGVRARREQLLDWMAEAQPDVLCLQEIKAPLDKIPPDLLDPPGYHARWHGEGGYSGVALLLRHDRFCGSVTFSHPEFDADARIVEARADGLVVASIYVPNGGRDLPAKLSFLEAMRTYAEALLESGQSILLCGDMNVARTDADIHPKERKGGKPLVGTLPEERALFESILESGLVDVGRALDPENQELFTWWAPWRNLRARNIGWRIDYVLASQDLHGRAERCEVLREVGTSDHGPVVATFED